VLVKLPTLSAVLVTVVAGPTAGLKVVVIVSLGVKPLPVTFITVPLGPLGGATIRAGPTAFGRIALRCWPLLPPPPGAVAAACAAGAATIKAGKLLRSSAAVTAYAAKLFRSEYKVPSSSER